MRIMAETAAKNPDRAKLQEALKAGKWEGIMGTVDFEDYDGFMNQNNHQMLVQQIQDGQYVTVFPKVVAKKKAVYPFPTWK